MRIPGLFPSTVFRRPSIAPSRAPSVASSSAPSLRPPAVPASPKPAPRSVRDSFRDISTRITGQSGESVLASQSHIAPKTLAQVTQNLIVADRLHKAGVFSTAPQLGTVARDAFVNAGINGLVSAPMSIATYAGSTWTGEAIKGQYAAQTPLLPSIHQPAPSAQAATIPFQGTMPVGTVAGQGNDVETQIKLAELRIEVVANNIMAIRQGTDAPALTLSERSPASTGERLTMLEALYDVAERQLKVIGDEHDMVFRAYRDPAGTAADTAPRRLERLDKRFEAVNRFIGKLIVIKEAELPVETTAGTATV